MKGVPLRVEIGPRDLQAKQVTLVRRDNRKKTLVSDSDSINEIISVLDQIQTALYEKARQGLQDMTVNAGNMEIVKQVIEEKGGFVKVSLCSDPDCENKIQAETGATVRVIPFNSKKTNNCVYCGKADSREVYLSRSY
jgi:prolyl-tRNA synthetase